jgi:tetratricopeptide (TPR) repeat protein
MNDSRTPPATAAGADAGDSRLVPGWLALVVLILLVAVLALGGYALRETVMQRRTATPEASAVSEWERRATATPSNPSVLLGLGYAYQQAGRPDDALLRYDQVLEIAPDNLAARFNRGVVLDELGRTAEADRAYWDLLALAPDHVLAAKMLGERYVERGEYVSALLALEAAVAANPRYADLQYLAGYASEQLGKRGAAARYYRAALTYAPDHEGAREGLLRLGLGE